MSKILIDFGCSLASIWNSNPIISNVKLSLDWSYIFPARILFLDVLFRIQVSRQG